MHSNRSSVVAPHFAVCCFTLRCPSKVPQPSPAAVTLCAWISLLGCLRNAPPGTVARNTRPMPVFVERTLNHVIGLIIFR